MIQVIDGGDFDRSSELGKKWLESGCILEVEPKRFAEL